MREYDDALAPADHPFVAARPPSWRLFGWGTIVREVTEAETTHLHPPAWVSGVYYPRIPDEVDEIDPDHGGWIEFGRPPSHIKHSFEPPVLNIHPREGMLILFPAYFYHRILPFRTASARMSLAFDAMPVRS